MVSAKVVLKNIGYGISLTTLIGTTVGIFMTGNYIHKNVISVKSINQLELNQSSNSEIYADDGKTLIWTDATYQHRPNTPENTPEVLMNMLIATEDNTFYKNEGYSKIAILNTVYTSLKDKLTHTDTARGGSTITQQLIKNIRYLNSDISVYDRKVQEIVLAKKLTEQFSKEDILMAYLNKVGFLESSYGFNTAMYLLYGEEISREKTTPDYLAKYATIIGMLKNPSIYNPRTNPEETEERRNQVLQNAYDQGYITEEEFNQATATSVQKDLQDQGWLTQQTYETAKNNGAYVNSILKQLETYGYDIKNTNHPIKVVSNLNIEQNEWLQNEVAKPEHYANERQQIAVTVVEPGTGKVLAQVGGRYGGAATDLNRANQVSRSSGSTIKPFLSYAPLIEFSDVTESTTWKANTTTYAGTNVTVYNYAHIMFGTATTQTALKYSMNVPAVDALSRQEPWMNQTIMSNLGLKDHKVNDNGDYESINTFAGSQALGIHESTDKFASAFASLVNKGKSVNNMYVKTVTQDGETIELDKNERQSMSPRTASKLLRMLETTLESDGSARNATIPEFKGYAVKTGTVGFDNNQDLYYDKEHKDYYGTVGQTGLDLIASDQWMAGVTKSVSIAVWTGFDDQAIYGDWLDPNNQGRSTVLVHAMKHFNEGKDTSQFDFDETKVELTKKQAPETVELSDKNKTNVLIQSNLQLPELVPNGMKATEEQKKFQKDFSNNSLSDPYKNIKPYFDEGNSLKYALYMDSKPESTHFYKIDDSGNLVSE
jgi:penicillin-binding protein 1A